ncbi:MAG: HNH endonuclease [Myxococcales bacterium]
MSEALEPSRLHALGAAAALMPWPLPREPDEAVCQQAARVIDALLVRVARGRGAIDVAIGEALDELTVGDRKSRLGYSNIGDYAREVIGIAASTAYKMGRLARKLRERSLLRAAVRAGEVSIRAAEAVLPKALGEEEAKWVELARIGTVRGLKAAAKKGPGALDETATDDEKWGPIRARVTPEQRAVADEAMEVARKLVGAAESRWKLLEALCDEYVGGHAPPDFLGGPDELVAARREELDDLKEWLEQESEQWGFLDEPDAVAAPVLSDDDVTDVARLDEGLRRLAKLRERWDEVFGHLALLLRSADGPRRLGFASFEHYTTERLGMAVRSVEQRIALERDLYELPKLREAMRAGRVSYEKARLIAREADQGSVEALIQRAEKVPCIDLRRELEDKEQAQLCARGEFEVWAPYRISGLVAFAFGAARKAAGRWIRTGECLARIAAHFLEVWKPVVERRGTPSRRILERDRGLCRVPGCSRAADHAHHIRFRSAGGSDDPSNQISLCAAHHLHGVHMGWIRVTGTAPDGLSWELGIAAPRREGSAMGADREG